ncbi:NAD(+) synthase [Prevotella sp. E15-22]|uniref:NAD(+) synthase n=1 Tax=Prevotella sp. E15-22 TaxID=2937774 RepID=UPI00204C86E0|nr:NAD(+) synthase [Prevotella sp. E15-22]UPS45083.1 NAD(+) synthase [Prevotella sp. E15-22]
MDYKKVFETMVAETSKYLADHRLKTMVLGLSGGIDSTVTAAVCHEVVKRNPDLKFIGVSMPCTTNSVEENDSASKAMKAFCTEYWVENLQAQYLLMKATCEQHYASTALSQGNIKARLRMIYLYNIASVTGGMVMDTDNLTEHYLGFWTIHGDVADYNPIGGLWKHEVYALCKYLFTEVFTDTNDARYQALKSAYDIMPTDGNGVSAGGDMAQIAPGHTYEEVDDILKSYISKKDEPEAQTAEVERLNKVYGADTVERVLNRHRNSEFKRKRLPIAIARELYED